MYKGSLFETTGKEHNENRKTINPFFAHPLMIQSTIKAFNQYSDARWGEEVRRSRSDKGGCTRFQFSNPKIIF